MKVFFILLVVSLAGCNKPEKGFTISFVGDILLDRGVRERIDHIGYERFYDEVSSRIVASEYLIGNLECPVTPIVAPVTKKYIFRGEKENLAHLKNIGFTHLNLANNHSYDQGRSGLTDTYRNLERSGIIPLGYGVGHLKSCEPTIIRYNDMTVAIFSTVTLPLENWMVLDGEPTICQARPEELTLHIKRFKHEHPVSSVIVQLHWGIEHMQQPTPDQRKWAHSLIEAGADVIIGHHPHVIQTIETYRGKPIYYSIGNCIFDQQNERNRAGLQVFVEVNPDKVTTWARSYPTNY